MGRDLTLCPAYLHVQNRSDHEFLLGYARLPLHRNGYLFDAIKALNPRPLKTLTTRFEYYFDDGLKRMTTDCYGDELTYITAKELANLKTEYPQLPWNRGVLELFKHVYPDMPIVLWWH